jgi:alpha-tubulin suppressor-like RCC1 family protein
MKKPTVPTVLAVILLNFAPGADCFAQQLAGGGFHSLALCKDSIVRAWGYNFFGALGNGTTTDSNVPLTINSLTGVETVSGGVEHSLAIKQGVVWAWGNNNYGQLGDGTTTTTGCRCKTAPVMVSGLSGIVAVDGGNGHSLALDQNGVAWAWGRNDYGQLGEGTTVDRYMPVQPFGLGPNMQISASGFHNLALKSDSTVWGWGRNQYGQVGDGSTTDRHTPVQVSGLAGITAVAAGYTHSLALRKDGTVWAWGANDYGQLGNGTIVNSATPVQVSGLSGITAISCGYRHCLAVKNDGTVWAWGSNYYSQLGDGTGVMYKTTPVQVNGLGNITSVSCGQDHSMAIAADGSAWVWGRNDSGQLGDGTTVNKNTPAKLDSLCSSVVTGIPSYKKDPAVRVFPNPSGGRLTIELGDHIAKGALSVVSVLGSGVYATEVHSGPNILELNIPEGIYFLQIKTGDETHVQKLNIRR